jgi:sensor histidine kinase YesM
MAVINDIPWFLMMSLLPVFFLFEFSVPHRLLLSFIIMTATFFIVIPPRLITFGLMPVSWLALLDRINRAHSIITIIISIFVSLWGVKRKIIGSLTVTIGLFIFLAGAYVSFHARLENGWAVGFAFLIIIIMVSLSRQMAAQNRAYHETQLRSTRLELELIKRQIQPHFLLNSLNSIVAWLEEEPVVATRLVTALAEELRMLLDFSGRKTVSLEEEIRLCKAHLDVMGLRRDKKFTFTVDGDCQREQVPPLIIHTMIENGLTHGYKGRDSGIFVLKCVRKGSSLLLEIFNDSTVSGNADPKSEGTGLKYVRTRLEESYPGAWSLKAGQVENGWKALIEINGVNA